MFLRLVLIFFLLPLVALAEQRPGPLSDTISDFASIIPSADEAEMRRLLRQNLET